MAIVTVGSTTWRDRALLATLAEQTALDRAEQIDTRVKHDDPWAQEYAQHQRAALYDLAHAHGAAAMVYEAAERDARQHELAQQVSA